MDPHTTTWHHGGVDKTTAPASTYILVCSVMALFASFGTVVIFLPPWQWYLIPGAFLVPIVVILTMRILARRRLRHELDRVIAELG